MTPTGATEGASGAWVGSGSIAGGGAAGWDRLRRHSAISVRLVGGRPRLPTPRDPRAGRVAGRSGRAVSRARGPPARARQCGRTIRETESSETTREDGSRERITDAHLERRDALALRYGPEPASKAPPIAEEVSRRGRLDAPNRMRFVPNGFPCGTKGDRRQKIGRPVNCRLAESGLERRSQARRGRRVRSASYGNPEFFRDPHEPRRPSSQGGGRRKRSESLCEHEPELRRHERPRLGRRLRREAEFREQPSGGLAGRCRGRR
jgi:hypothetical protein